MRLSGRASALSNQFTHIVRLVFDFGLASVAIPRTIMDNRMPAALQERLEAPLIAICTNCMGWFAVLHSLFRNEGEKASPQVLQFVALLICIPCFQCSHFFFKLAYVLNQRRLLRLCGEDFPLEVYNRSVASGSVVDILKMRAQRSWKISLVTEERLFQHYLPIAEARARGGAKFVGYHPELGIAFEKAFHRARSTLLRIS